MKYLFNWIFLIFISLSLNSCSKNLTSIELTVYTFGNKIKAKQAFPDDIKEIIQPIDNFCLSKIYFEDKANEWQNKIDLESISNQSGSLNYLNKEGNRMLLNKYFDSTENLEPKNRHILYNYESQTKIYSVDDYNVFFSELKEDTGRFVLIYTSDNKYPKNENVYFNKNKIKDKIKDCSKTKPWRSICILYEPPYGRNETISENNDTIAMEGDESITTEVGLGGGSKYDTIKYNEQKVTLVIENNKISWENFQVTGDNIQYQVIFERYRGHNPDIYLNKYTVNNNKYFNFSNCKECIDLPHQSELKVSVKLGDMLIADCRLEPTNNRVHLCHCVENSVKGNIIIKASK